MPHQAVSQCHPVLRWEPWIIDNLMEEFHQLSAQLWCLLEEHPSQAQRIAPDEGAYSGGSATDDCDVTLAS